MRFWEEGSAGAKFVLLAHSLISWKIGLLLLMMMMIGKFCNRRDFVCAIYKQENQQYERNTQNE